jgi:hypothetical protein
MTHQLTVGLRSEIAAFVILVFAIGIAGLAGCVATKSRSDQTAVEGLVRDISCPIQNREATATTFNLQCALECVKQGSPLIILSKGGVIYVPISDSMPDQDQRARLMPFVGKYVKVTGKAYERNGTHAIAISQISEMKDVHLVTDAQ